jgi:Flp pilus assembly protein TadG
MIRKVTPNGALPLGPLLSEEGIVLKKQPQTFESRSALQHVKSERGSALLEFAVVVIIFLTFVFAIMDFSQALYAYHFVSNAAREATRYASVRGTTFAAAGACSNPLPVEYNCEAATADITAYVQSLVPPGMAVSGKATASCAAPGLRQLYVCINWPGTAPAGAKGACPANPAGGKNPGCLAEVQVQYLYVFTLPFVSKDVSSIPMTSTSEMIIEQ